MRLALLEERGDALDDVLGRERECQLRAEIVERVVEGAIGNGHVYVVCTGSVGLLIDASEQCFGELSDQRMLFRQCREMLWSQLKETKRKSTAQ